MAKFAIKRVGRDALGNLTIGYVDANTGKPIASLAGYELLEQGVDFNKTPKAPDTTVKPKVNSTLPPEITRVLHYGPDINYDDSDIEPRSQSNNFGYVSKPTFMKYASAVPGMIGFGAKAINVAINANNIAATNAARATMGLPALSKTEAAKGLISDRKGYIGDAVIGGKQYAVSFEAMTPDGRTALTPTEAAKRVSLAGGNVRPATEDEVKQAEANAKANPDIQGQKGFLEKAGGVIKEGLGKIGEAVGFDSKKVGTYTPPTPREIAPEQKISNLRNLEGTQFGPAGASGLRQNPDAPSTGTVAAVPGRLLGVNELGVEVREKPTAQISYNNKGQRNQKPNQDFMDTVSKAVAGYFGPGYTASLESGKGWMKDPKTGTTVDEHGHPVGGNANHPTGKAGDFKVYDPSGNQVGQTRMEGFGKYAASNWGIKGVGIGPGYMDPGEIHLDTVHKTITAWGNENSGKNMTPGVEAAIEGAQPGMGLAEYQPNIPTARPEPPKEESVAESTIKNQLAEPSVGDLSAPRTRPSDLKTAMAVTIAGELGQNTIAGILSGDPKAINVARQEIAGIVGTIDNRAASAQYATQQNPYDAVMNEKDYNSLMAENQKTTLDNFSKVGDFIEGAIDDIDLGTLSSLTPEATHYRATYAHPAWEKFSIGLPEQVGEHKFSQVGLPGAPNTPEYSGNAAGFGKYYSGASDSPSRARTTDASRFGFPGAGSIAGQRSAGVSGYDSRRAEGTFGGFRAGSLAGSAGGLGSGLGKTGTSGSLFSGFSHDYSHDYSGNKGLDSPSEGHTSAGRGAGAGTSTGTTGFGGKASTSSSGPGVGRGKDHSSGGSYAD